MTDKLTLTGETLRDQQDTIASQLEQPEDRMRRALEQLGGGSSNTGRVPRSGSPGESFSGSRKHRFVQDGDVTVTHVQTRRDRAPRSATAAAADATFSGSRDPLAEERGLRLRAERAAQEAQSAVAALQTKLGHAEIALSEARNAAQSQAAAIIRLQTELQGQDTQILALQERLDAGETERQKLAQKREAMPVAEAQATPMQATPMQATPMQAAPMQAAPSQAPKTLRAAGPARKMSKATRSVLQSQKALGSEAGEPQPIKWWLSKKG